MFLTTRDGIICDLCGTIHREIFTYYSIDQTPYDIMTMAVSSGKAESFDVCEPCFEKMKDNCKKHLGAHKKTAIKCDFCPKYMQGEFKYYRMMIARVTVDRDQEGPQNVEYKHMDFNVCKDCGTKTLNTVEGTRKAHSEGGWS